MTTSPSEAPGRLGNCRALAVAEGELTRTGEQIAEYQNANRDLITHAEKNRKDLQVKHAWLHDTFLVNSHALFAIQSMSLVHACCAEASLLMLALSLAIQACIARCDCCMMFHVQGVCCTAFLQDVYHHGEVSC